MMKLDFVYEEMNATGEHEVGCIWYLNGQEMSKFVVSGFTWQRYVELLSTLRSDDLVITIRNKKQSDPISQEMKNVAVAIFGEKLNTTTVDGRVAIDNVAAAVAATLYPDTRQQDNSRLRNRFMNMCSSEPEIVG